MKTEESLYIKILTWAYEKPTGFTDEEILEKFKLKDGNGENYKIYIKLFKDGANPLINSEYDYTTDTHTYYLSDRGMSAVIDYLDLKEARDSSKDAKRWAMWSIWIAIIIGIAQVILSAIQIWIQVCS